MRTYLHAAFTLVELSIVLTIIGLLAGGMVAGKILIHNAELKRATNDIATFRTAMGTFEEKYNALPGDMANAVRIWGAHAGGTTDGVDSDCADEVAEATGTETCNGDGNGFIANGTAQYYEAYRAWQHLANAGLVDGHYWGNSQVSRTAQNAIPDVNAPDGRVGSGAAWQLSSFTSDQAAGASWFFMPAGNFMTLCTFPSSDTMRPVLKPGEAWNIDTKYDDGKPGTGLVTGFPSTNAAFPNCTVNGSSNTDYKISDSSVACAINIQFRNN